MIGILDGAKQIEEMLLFIIYVLPWVYAAWHDARLLHESCHDKNQIQSLSRGGEGFRPA